MVSDVDASGASADGACRTKAQKMSLANHKTAFYALRDLPGEHVEALKAKGYNEESLYQCSSKAKYKHCSTSGAVTSTRTTVWLLCRSDTNTERVFCVRCER